jgi:hypothetical protein
MTTAHESLAKRLSTDARFIEGWMRGTYVVAGVFAIPSEALTVAEIERNIPALYAVTQSAKKGWWPRGLSGTFLFPFYIGTHFEPDVIARVQRRRRYRWAVWHEPVLYDVVRNGVWMRSDYGLYGSAFYPLTFDLYRRAMLSVAELLQKAMPDFINGVATNGRNA